MKVRDLIEKLQQFDQEDEVLCISKKGYKREVGTIKLCTDNGSRKVAIHAVQMI